MNARFGKDLIDEKLVALLRQNARASVAALSKAVNLSRTAVQARIVRLERDGVITGYQAVLGEAGSEEQLGAVLSIVFSVHPCAPVVAKFRSWPEVTHHYSVTGPIDAYVLVRAENSAALSELVARFSALEGIASVSSAVILKSD
ncbi:MAG: Lrp/AsnC family transcriptional regulator [Novosphingobium sp.]|uniref:Lrp/AsnC family transcriptional regulator n=1 Tax=Novosphingobium sp. TaxID=1874826 RepID=UPI0017EA14D2|nr:Lrp/AsnC family transcriptional regulator [Novosphingobium sp.]